MIRQELHNSIWQAAQTIGRQSANFPLKPEDIALEHPDRPDHGDYATSAALQLAKNLKKNPFEIATLLKQELERMALAHVQRVEIAGPGFLNFFLSPAFFHKTLSRILKEKARFGSSRVGKGKSAQVEFISANPTGPMTLANARGGFYGDTLANVLAKAGFRAERAYYVNDYGNQILALGHSVLQDAEAVYKGEYIDRLHARIKEKDAYKAGEKAAAIILKEIIKKTVTRMGIVYDDWVLESALHKSSKVDKALSMLKTRDMLYEQDGAVFFKAKQFGDVRDRVVIKSDGTKTYLAGDIAYHLHKFQERKFHKAINIWGADHQGDVAGLKGAMEVLGHKGKLDVILLQFVTLLSKGEIVRMSKRKGVYVTVDDLLDEVGNDAARFFMLKLAGNTHLNFDLALAKEQSEKNPVYYVQYAHARICSILRKAGKKDTESTASGLYGLLKTPDEIALLKQLAKFPEVVEKTSADYQVQRLPQYAFDVAAAFHQFYQTSQVLSDDERITRARLALARAAQIVLKNTLSLMGISAPERM